jgi:hypothetical protein
MKTSSTGTGSASNFSGGLWLHKGTTIKGTILTFSSVVNKTFYIISRFTFEKFIYFMEQSPS